jgi:hypothetical protein
MPIIHTPPIQGGGPSIGTQVLRDFTGGINLRDEYTNLAANEHIEMIDFEPLGNGGVSRRTSFRPLGVSGVSSAKRAKFLFHFNEEATGGYVFVGGRDGSGNDVLSYWYNTAIAETTVPTATRTFTTASGDTRYWSGALMKTRPCRRGRHRTGCCTPSWRTRGVRSTTTSTRL